MRHLLILFRDLRTHYTDAFRRTHFSIWQKLYVPLKWEWESLTPWMPKYLIQRAIHGYSDYDLCNFYGHLAQIIVSGLRDLKKDRHGYPGGLNNREEWDEILDKIIFGFRLMIDDEWWYIRDDGTIPDNPNIDIEDAKKYLMLYFEALWL